MIFPVHFYPVLCDPSHPLTGHTWDDPIKQLLPPLKNQEDNDPETLSSRVSCNAFNIFSRQVFYEESMMDAALEKFKQRSLEEVEGLPFSNEYKEAYINKVALFIKEEGLKNYQEMRKKQSLPPSEEPSVEETLNRIEDFFDPYSSVDAKHHPPVVNPIETPLVSDEELKVIANSPEKIEYFVSSVSKLVINITKNYNQAVSSPVSKEIWSNRIDQTLFYFLLQIGQNPDLAPLAAPLATELAPILVKTVEQHYNYISRNSRDYLLPFENSLPFLLPLIYKKDQREALTAKTVQLFESFSKKIVYNSLKMQQLTKTLANSGVFAEPESLEKLVKKKQSPLSVRDKVNLHIHKLLEEATTDEKKAEILKKYLPIINKENFSFLLKTASLSPEHLHKIYETCLPSGKSFIFCNFDDPAPPSIIEEEKEKYTELLPLFLDPTLFPENFDRGEFLQLFIYPLLRLFEEIFLEKDLVPSWLIKVLILLLKNRDSFIPKDTWYFEFKLNRVIECLYEKEIKSGDERDLIELFAAYRKYKDKENLESWNKTADELVESFTQKTYARASKNLDDLFPQTILGQRESGFRFTSLLQKALNLAEDQEGQGLHMGKLVYSLLNINCNREEITGKLQIGNFVSKTVRVCSLKRTIKAALEYRKEKRPASVWQNALNLIFRKLKTYFSKPEGYKVLDILLQYKKSNNLTSFEKLALSILTEIGSEETNEEGTLEERFREFTKPLISSQEKAGKSFLEIFTDEEYESSKECISCITHMQVSLRDQMQAARDYLARVEQEAIEAQIRSRNFYNEFRNRPWPWEAKQHKNPEYVEPKNTKPRLRLPTILDTEQVDSSSSSNVPSSKPIDPSGYEGLYRITSIKKKGENVCITLSPSIGRRALEKQIPISAWENSNLKALWDQGFIQGHPCSLDFIEQRL